MPSTNKPEARKIAEVSSSDSDAHVDTIEGERGRRRRLGGAESGREKPEREG